MKSDDPGMRVVWMRGSQGRVRPCKEYAGRFGTPPVPRNRGDRVSPNGTSGLVARKKERRCARSRTACGRGWEEEGRRSEELEDGGTRLGRAPPPRRSPRGRARRLLGRRTAQGRRERREDGRRELCPASSRTGATPAGDSWLQGWRTGASKVERADSGERRPGQPVRGPGWRAEEVRDRGWRAEEAHGDRRWRPGQQARVATRGPRWKNEEERIRKKKKEKKNRGKI